MAALVAEPDPLPRLPTVSTRSISEKTCSICTHDLDDLQRKWYAELAERPVKLPCGHVFGATCIEMWLVEHQTCPMCRCSVSVSGLANIGEKPAGYLNYLLQMRQWDVNEFAHGLRELVDPNQRMYYYRIGNGTYHRNGLMLAILAIRANAYSEGEYREEDVFYATYRRRCTRYGRYNSQTGPVVYENLVKRLWDFMLRRFYEALSGADGPTAACHPAVGLALEQILSYLRGRNGWWMSPSALEVEVKTELGAVPVLQRDTFAPYPDAVQCEIDLEPYMSNLVEVVVQRFAADRPSVNPWYQTAG